MKAATARRYGSADVIAIEDLPRPIPGPGKMLIKVAASSVTTADWRLRASAFPGGFWLPGRLMFGLFAPRNPVLGGDFAGHAVGASGRFADGAPVFGFSTLGAHAQYLVMAENGAVAPRPDGLSDAEAAAVPFGALAALWFLRSALKVTPGMRVLIIGASGGVGVFAVQLARHMGAEVTAMASPARRDLALSLGADRVIARGALEPARYDAILDCVGATGFRRARRALAPGGVYCPLEFGLGTALAALLSGLIGGRRVTVGVSPDTREALEEIADLLERGVIRPVIESRFPLARINEAHTRVEARAKAGAVVIDIA
jgi:NADPH:quinone reductase-like Zn-dependent oxidoreductase